MSNKLPSPSAFLALHDALADRIPPEHSDRAFKVSNSQMYPDLSSLDNRLRSVVVRTKTGETPASQYDAFGYEYSQLVLADGDVFEQKVAGFGPAAVDGAVLEPVCLARAFARIAENDHELAHVAEHFGRRTDKETHERKGFTSYKQMHQKTLGIIAQRAIELDLAADPDTQFFAALGHRFVHEKSGTLHTRNLALSVGKIVIGATSDFRRDQWIAPPDENVVRFVDALDKQIALPESFWVDSCIVAGGALFTKGLASLLVNRIRRAENGMASQLHIPSDRAETYTRAYITRVLRDYSEDCERNSINARKLLENMRPSLGADASIARLIEISNHVSARYNQAKKLRPSDEGFRAPLLAADFASASDALLRVLELTRGTEDQLRLLQTDGDIRAEQFEEDLMHSEIIAFLRTGRTKGRNHRAARPPRFEG